MNNGLFFIEHIPYANMEGIWIDIWACLMIYACIFTACYTFMHRQKLFLYISLSISFILILKTSFSRIKQEGSNQIIFYSLRKGLGISFFEGNDGVLITDLNNTDKAYSYAIKPSVESAEINPLKIFSPGSVVSERNFFYDKNFIQFRNRSILIWDKGFNKKNFSNPVSVDILFLHENPQVTVKALREFVRFKVLLIGTSNPDYKINAWQTEADNKHVAYYVLKSQPAYVVKL